MVVEIAPTIQGLYVSTASMSEVKLLPPYSVTGQLHNLMTIQCAAVGSPQPYVTWYRNGDVYYQGSTVSFNALHPNNRGVYYCNATNTVASVSSQEILLNISGTTMNDQ